MQAWGDAILQVVRLPFIGVCNVADVALEVVFSDVSFKAVALGRIIRAGGHDGRIPAFDGRSDAATLSIWWVLIIDNVGEHRVGLHGGGHEEICFVRDVGQYKRADAFVVIS